MYNLVAYYSMKRDPVFVNFGSLYPEILASKRLSNFPLHPILTHFALRWRIFTSLIWLVIYMPLSKHRNVIEKLSFIKSCWKNFHVIIEKQNVQRLLKIKLKQEDKLPQTDRPCKNFPHIYTVSEKKVTPCIHCHNSGKQCQILTKFWINNAMSNCKQITKFK